MLACLNSGKVLWAVLGQQVPHNGTIPTIPLPNSPALELAKLSESLGEVLLAVSWMSDSHA